jgi:hypothetical protein
MKQDRTIPLYGPDGTSLGYRTPEAAERLVASGYVKPAYGRKGHMKAIFLPREDGSSPVETHPIAASRYSFLETLEKGRCWKLRRVDGRDEDGTPMRTRGVFLQVVSDCLIRPTIRQGSA